MWDGAGGRNFWGEGFDTYGTGLMARGLVRTRDLNRHFETKRFDLGLVMLLCRSTKVLWFDPLYQGDPGAQSDRPRRLRIETSVFPVDGWSFIPAFPTRDG